MHIRTVLQNAAAQLSSHSESARLDAELLLAHVLNTSRLRFFTDPEDQITTDQAAHFDHLLTARLQGVPIAYLIGTREFWSLPFVVTPDTLIPRPDTELLVSLALSSLPHTPCTLADLGTGTGAIALSLAHARPTWDILATDVCPKALAIAQKNAQALNINHVRFQQGSWCEALADQRFHAIVSNPPYLSTHDPHLQGEIRHEPRHALVSGPSGLEVLMHLTLTAKNHLLPGGILLLEHGATQADAVRKRFQSTGYREITTHRDLNGHPRVTMGFIAPPP